MENKYLTSAQFAKLCGITKDALLWYEKKGLISPARVGENGYHYYTYDQYFDVDIVKTLKAAGLPLEEIREYMQNRSTRNYVDIMLRQQELLSRKISELLLQKASVDITVRDCLTMQSRYSEKPRIVYKEERHFLTEPIKEHTSEGIAKAFMRLFANRRKSQALYKTSSTMLNGMIIPQEQLSKYSFRKPSMVCLKLSDPIPEPCCLSLKAGEHAVLFHSGSRDTIDESYHRLLDFIEEQHSVIDGDSVEADFINYLSSNDSDHYIKQISIPIRRKAGSYMAVCR